MKRLCYTVERTTHLVQWVKLSLKAQRANAQGAKGFKPTLTAQRANGLSARS